MMHVCMYVCMHGMMEVQASKSVSWDVLCFTLICLLTSDVAKIYDVSQTIVCDNTTIQNKHMNPSIHDTSPNDSPSG